MRCLLPRPVGVLLAWLLFSTPLGAQSVAAWPVAWGVKAFGLSIHPHGAVNHELMPLKFDDEGVFVLNTGFTVGFEAFVPGALWLSVKAVQGAYLDCVGQPAGFSHLGVRFHTPSWGGFSFNGGLGPSLLYRKNWYDLRGYDDAFSFFRGRPGDLWQTRFLWYGGEFEFNQDLGKGWALSQSVVPGYPDLISVSVGFKYTPTRP